MQILYLYVGPGNFNVVIIVVHYSVLPHVLQCFEWDHVERNELNKCSAQAALHMNGSMEGRWRGLDRELK